MNSESSEPPIVDLAPPPLATIAEPTLASSHETVVAASALHPLSLVFELAHRVRTNLIPAIFASFSAATGGIVGLYVGLGIFGIAIVLAVIRFITFRYRLTDDHLLVDQGLLFRTHRSVPIDRIQNIDSVQNLFHRFFKVAEVRIETASGNEPEAIMRVISLEEVERLRSQLNRLSTSRAGLASPVVSQAHISHDANAGQAVTVNASTVDLSGAAAETVLKIPVSQLIKAGLISNRGQVLAGLVFGYFIQASVRGDRIEKMVGANDRDSWRSWIRLAIKETGQAIDGLNWFGAMGNQVVTASVIVLAVILLVFVLRLFSAVWFVLKFYDYQLVRRGRDFQIQCGLFTKVSASVPGDRIQVVCVHRTLLARWFGLAAIRVEASGGSGKEDEDASATVARQWFVPVMSAEDLPRVLQTLQPQLESTTQSLDWKPLAPRAYQRMIRLPLMVFALVFLVSVTVGSLLDWSYAVVPLVVSIVGGLITVLLARKRAKSRKFARTEHGYIYRSGTLTQKTSYGFWDRTQAVSFTQSPFDRRWGMAALLFDTAAAGTADHTLSIEYLAVDTAIEEYQHACSLLT